MLASRCSVSFSLANTYKRTYTMAYGFQDSRLQIGESLELLTFLLKGKKEGGGLCVSERDSKRRTYMHTLHSYILLFLSVLLRLDSLV